MYLDELLEYTILKNRCDELLRYLFDIDKFRDFLQLRTPEEIGKAYEYTLMAVINKINTALYLGRHELQYIQGHFYVVETGKKPAIEATNIKLINLPKILESPYILACQAKNCAYPINSFSFTRLLIAL